MISLENLRIAKGLDPVADAFAGTVRSDVLKVSEAHKALFLLYKGVGATGTSLVTVSACDDNSPSTETAVAFRYRRLNTTNTPGAVTAATSAGFTTTAGSSDLYAIEVDIKALAASGYKYVCLKCVESVASAVVGAIVAMLVPRYADHSADITS
jgi:hypothetical protein